MIRCFCFITVALLIFITSAATAEESAGLFAEWNFDEGKGDIAKDSSGNGRDLKLHDGATWQRHAEGYCLSMDGFDDYANRKSLGITGPITIETWIKPMRKADGLAGVAGEGLQRYQLTFYNTEVCDLFIGAGGNNARGGVALFEWNHVAATYDGDDIVMWVNGRKTHTKKSRFKNYKNPGTGLFTIGTKGRPDLPHFKGMLDKLRVYTRSLPSDEIVEHFKQEAADYGVDPTWFKRFKLTSYQYFDQGKVVVTADYQGLQPFKGKGSLEVTLINKVDPGNILHRKVIESLPDHGVAELQFPVDKLANGDYVICAKLKVGDQVWPMEESAFSYPTKPSPVPAPKNEIVSALPPKQTPTPFTVKVNKGGGFQITSQGVNYSVQSRVSWPNGDFNRLAASDEPFAKGEKTWKSNVQESGKNKYTIKAGGDYYAINREIEIFPTHVYVKDRYTNTTKTDLGLLIYNEIPIKPEKLTQSLLSGNDKRGRLPVKGYPDYGPTLFFADDNNGMGVIPIDDVYTIQAVPYVEHGAAGVCTERFALAPGNSYTLDWAVYPTDSKDYYDFINNFRQAEGRISTVQGPPGFISWGPMNRRQVPDKDFIEKRGMKIGIVSVLGRLADEPELSANGLSFLEYPKERRLLKRQASAIHRRHPNFKVVFHIAHSLYLNNNPEERFPDSRVIQANGKQAVWGTTVPYVSQRRIDEGWTWWVYYPTPGNSFHNALIKGADVLMDEMGFDGAFMDGFFAAYQGMWSYDTDIRWDGHTADIDRKTKTITRKVNSVLLLSQPSMIEFARRIRNKGGVVIGNSAVFTRSMANEKYIIFDSEVASGPALHTAPNITALRGGSSDTEKGVYLDMLDKLSWGMLFLYYNERINLTYPSLAAKQFPITFEEIRSGLVRGKERIVTMNSGIYGWHGDRSLHMVYKFDDRGAPVPNSYNTTVDADSVRTELIFKENESAVIEPIPVDIDAKGPVNVRVLHIDESSLTIMLNGRGSAVLNMFVGTEHLDKRDKIFTDGGVNPADIGYGMNFNVAVNGKTTITKEIDGMLAVKLNLSGEVLVTIKKSTD